MSNGKKTPYIIKTMSSDANPLPLLVCLSLAVSFVLCCLFFSRGDGGCASGRLKVICCWKGSEVKPLLIPVLWLPQRRLAVIRGRAWSASASLKWYPQAQHHQPSTCKRKPKSEGAASQLNRGSRNYFPLICITDIIWPFAQE